MDQIKSKIETQIEELQNLLDNLDHTSRVRAFNHLSSVGDDLMEAALELLEDEVEAA